MTTTTSSRTYDAVIVGASIAGAATAMLLARAGCDVLVVDRAQPDTDTLSTHALMRSGVAQLARWGLLDAIVERGTPPIRRTMLHYGHDEVPIEVRPDGVVDALYAPRRAVLDATVVDAAIGAGAHVRCGMSVDGLSTGVEGRVDGIVGRDQNGQRFHARAPIVVGADGIRSKVAEVVNAPSSGRAPARPASSTATSPTSRARATASSGTSARRRAPVSSRPTAPPRACGPGPTTVGSAVRSAATSGAASTRCSPRPPPARPPAWRRSSRSASCTRSPGCPGSCARPTGPAGPSSATPATSRAPSAPTASATPSATPSCSPARSSPPPIPGDPMCSPATRPHATSCRTTCSPPSTTSPARAGRSRSCPVPIEMNRAMQAENEYLGGLDDASARGEALTALV